jgi:hypothetical protein
VRELESARKDTSSRFQTIEVLSGKGAIKRSKADETIAVPEDARGNEAHLEQEVRGVTGNLVQERRKWFAKTSKDLRDSIRDYCFRQAEAERMTLANLESVRADIRAIITQVGSADWAAMQHRITGEQASRLTKGREATRGA